MCIISLLETLLKLSKLFDLFKAFFFFKRDHSSDLFFQITFISLYTRTAFYDKHIRIKYTKASYFIRSKNLNTEKR